LVIILTKIFVGASLVDQTVVNAELRWLDPEGDAPQGFVCAHFTRRWPTKDCFCSTVRNSVHTPYGRIVAFT
jgi:hypothetical protein